MSDRIIFRDFELRDVDFIYRVKNDRRVSETIVGDYTNFSYEDAVNWVRGAAKHDENYRYWAICTNDEFQNIVGWCGISEIDSVHKMAAFKTITIYSPEYRDLYTWYYSWMFILDYVFCKLDFNRVYSIVLTSHKFHMQVFEIFPKSYEGLLRHVVKKGEKYVDIALVGINRDDYNSLLKQGKLDFDFVITSLKQNIVVDNTIRCIDDFIAVFRKELNADETVIITPETKFRELEEWSSLVAITMVAIAEGGLRRTFNMNDLNQCDTIRDFYEMISKQ